MANSNSKATSVGPSGMAMQVSAQAHQRGSQQAQGYDTRQRFSPYSPRGVDSYSAIAGNTSLEGEKSRQFKIKFPMEPRDVVLHLGKYLLDSEKTEILEYD